MLWNLFPGGHHFRPCFHLDGDKCCYIDYYEMVLARLSDGGYIIADNTLWTGTFLKK